MASLATPDDLSTDLFEKWKTDLTGNDKFENFFEQAGSRPLGQPGPVTGSEFAFDAAAPAGSGAVNTSTDFSSTPWGEFIDFYQSLIKGGSLNARATTFSKAAPGGQGSAVPNFNFPAQSGGDGGIGDIFGQGAGPTQQTSGQQTINQTFDPVNDIRSSYPFEQFERDFRSDQLPGTLTKAAISALFGPVAGLLAGGVEDISKNSSYRGSIEDAGINTRGGPLEGGFLSGVNELFGFGGIDQHVSLSQESGGTFSTNPSISSGTATGQFTSNVGPAGVDIDIEDQRQTHEDLSHEISKMNSTGGADGDGTGGSGAPGADAAADAGVSDASDAGTDFGGSGGSGDSGGGGDDSVVCTELFHQGLIHPDMYRADSRRGTYLKQHDPQMMRGYHRWGVPLAAMMHQSPLLTHIVRFIAMPVIREQAAYEGGSLFGSIPGKLMFAIAAPICRWLGKDNNRIG